MYIYAVEKAATALFFREAKVGEKEREKIF